MWLIWLAVMSLPVVLSEFAPHFRRAIGLLPAVTVLAALGLDAIWSAFAASRLPAVIGRQAAPAILAIGLAASAFAAGRDYFVLLGPTNEYYYAFDTGLADMARYANTLPAADRVYYLPADNRHTTLQFLAARPVPRSFESRQVWVLRAGRRARHGLHRGHDGGYRRAAVPEAGVSRRPRGPRGQGPGGRGLLYGLPRPRGQPRRRGPRHGALGHAGFVGCAWPAWTWSRPGMAA